MKTLHRCASLLVAALITLGSLAACGSSTLPNQPVGTASAVTVLPVPTNPMKTTGTKPGLTVTGALAENNVDPQSKAAVPDRLQFDLTNTSTAPMTGLEAYYTMKDTTTGKTESYYQKLDGITLAPAQKETVYFDNGTSPGHYPENKYSIYRNSTNQVIITITAAATGYVPATGTATKSAGTGEKVD
ncbi:hypothetical protein AS189_09450 [Arthrobacter alpinus]|uniref:Lipoprotein n=1 Tax=Arthrobacter alpinus TaxID=656366 RepID=A0A0S2LYT9_9MICC|nr:hypothetical protein [Arthrobacter alpinus]ALO66677.1 hypothetical protein AS189_09450 [Arthrobacter alpinus]